MGFYFWSSFQKVTFLALLHTFRANLLAKDLLKSSESFLVHILSYWFGTLINYSPECRWQVQVKLENLNNDDVTPKITPG